MKKCNLPCYDMLFGTKQKWSSHVKQAFEACEVVKWYKISKQGFGEGTVSLTAQSLPPTCLLPVIAHLRCMCSLISWPEFTFHTLPWALPNCFLPLRLISTRGPFPPSLSGNWNSECQLQDKSQLTGTWTEVGGVSPRNQILSHMLTLKVKVKRWNMSTWKTNFLWSLMQGLKY